MSRARIAILPVIPNRRRYLLLAAVLFPVFAFLGYLSWELGYYPIRHLELAGQARLAGASLPSQQLSVLPVFPPLSFLLFLLFRSPMIISAFIGAVLVGYLVYYVTAYPTAPLVKTSLVLYLLISPSMVMLVLFDVEWAVFLLFGFLANYFVLEFYRQEYSFFLFMCGLCLGAMYLVVPDIFLYVPLLILGLAFIFRRPGRTLIYSAVIVFPIVSAAILWPLIEWLVSGEIFEPIPRFARSFDVDFILTSLRESGPFLAFYIVLGLSAMRHRRELFRPALAVLATPLLLVLLSLLWQRPVPIVAQVPLFMVNIVILYPYLDMVMPKWSLRLSVIIMVIAAFAGSVQNLLTPPDAMRREVLGMVRGEGGNVRQYNEIVEYLEEVPGHVLLQGETVHLAYLIRDRPFEQVWYDRHGGGEIPAAVSVVVQNLSPLHPADPPGFPDIPEFKEVNRTGVYRVLVRL